VGKELAEQPGVKLRDQLSHQLAVITEARFLCLVDIAHVRDGRILGWDGGPFYGENVVDQGPITRDAVWQRATVAQCFELLMRSFELTAELVSSTAVLEPPQRAYKNKDSGEVVTADPRCEKRTSAARQLSVRAYRQSAA
jgi:hypothetical protein